MGVPAIRLDSDPKSRTLYRHELRHALRETLVATKAQAAREVFIVRHGDVGQFLALRDIVIHCEKRPNRSLKQICLGQTLIPLVTGEYSDSGQFLRSVRTLLLNAVREEVRNLFLVSASDAMFEEHWRHALLLAREDARQTSDTTGALGGGTAAAPPEPAVDSVEGLIRLLPQLDIPASVEEQYVGDSPEVRLVRFYIVRAAANRDTVLILGDTGTGKEVVARLIHSLGAGHPGTFIPVNCGSIPRDLLESELFGFEKGSHSQADRKKEGLWLAAQGGTLFLDEVADLALDHQVKILRALDDHEIRPVGAVKTVHVDARILAATNKDLAAMVRSGLFRDDLYYRLRATMIRTPALHEHTGDIPKLVAKFWKVATHDESSVLAPGVVEFLKQHVWPGNVRELSLCLTSVHNLFGKDGIRIEHVRAVLNQNRQVARPHDGHVEIEDVRVHRVQCLRHLRRVDDTLRAAQVRLRDVMKGRSRVPATYEAIAAATEDRVNELEVLCLHPLLFYGPTPTMFTVVRRLKEKLRDFSERMRKEPELALEFWKRELEQDFAYALTMLFEEVDRLMKAG